MGSGHRNGSPSNLALRACGKSAGASISPIPSASCWICAISTIAHSGLIWLSSSRPSRSSSFIPAPEYIYQTGQSLARDNPSHGAIPRTGQSLARGNPSHGAIPRTGQSLARGNPSHGTIPRTGQSLARDNPSHGAIPPTGQSLARGNPSHGAIPDDRKGRLYISWRWIDTRDVETTLAVVFLIPASSF